jgi:hypothetical protein
MLVTPKNLQVQHSPDYSTWTAQTGSRITENVRRYEILSKTVYFHSPYMQLVQQQTLSFYSSWFFGFPSKCKFQFVVANSPASGYKKVISTSYVRVYVRHSSMSDNRRQDIPHNGIESLLCNAVFRILSIQIQKCNIYITWNNLLKLSSSLTKQIILNAVFQVWVYGIYSGLYMAHTCMYVRR